jgi:hypothetical protein
MKKQIITKVLFASFILAMSGFVLNLQAQDIVVEFTNPDDKDYGSSNDGFLGIGLGGSGSGATQRAWNMPSMIPMWTLSLRLVPRARLRLMWLPPQPILPLSMCSTHGTILRSGPLPMTPFSENHLPSG